MKTIFAALGGAVGTTLACWRLILILWAVNALAAWILVAPLHQGIKDSYQHNPISTGLLTSFDNESFVDFWGSSADAVGQAGEGIRASVFVWLMLWTVLSAGVVARVADRKRFDGFLASCGRYGHRFLWLLVMSLIGFWVVGWLNGFVSQWTTSLLVGDDNGAGAGLLGWSMTLKTLLMLGLAGLVVTAGRFARLRVVLLGERFVPLSWVKALGSVVRHLPSIGLGRILSLWPLVLAFFVYEGLSGALLEGDAMLPGLRLPWRMVLVFQVTQMIVMAALVYRMAVDARLWSIVAPPGGLEAPLASAVGPPPGDVPAPEASDPAPEPVEAPAAHPIVPTGEPPTDTAGSAGDEVTVTPDDTPTPNVDSSTDEDTGSASRPAFLALLVLLWIPSQLSSQDGAPPAAAAPATSTSRAVHKNAYVIDAQVDIEARTITATERATFINTTSTPVRELWLHLYAAAFSNTRTEWIEGGREEDIQKRGAEHGGYIDIQSVRLAGQDMAERTTIDDTLMHVQLSSPVAPGGRVEIEIRFVTRFPHIIARMGQVGRHIDGMQWYPKFCSHDESGWKNRRFHRIGEFYADFGSYDVTFRYPASIGGDAVVLEATGVPGPEQAAGEGMLQRRYQAQDVHDFAFCVDPSFTRHEDSFVDPVSGQSIEIVYLCQPYAEPKVEQVMAVMKSCLASAAEWWMPYPYPRIVVDGLPHSQGGGMEYPMLFTISQSFPNHLDWLVELTEDQAGVTAHKFGHQYRYGILASDEVDEAWLDEGLNSWGTTKLIEAHWPDAGTTDFLTFLDRKLVREALNGGVTGVLPISEQELSLQRVIGWNTSPFHDAPPHKPASQPTLLGFRVPDVNSLRLPDMSANRAAWGKSSYRSVADARPLSAPSREFSTGYGGLVYRKTALVLQTLENHIGEESMREVMKTYVERHAFGHPTGEDFLKAVRDVTGGVHDNMLRQLVTTAGTVDFTVEEVNSYEIGPVVGYSAQSRPGQTVEWIEPPANDDGGSEEPSTLEGLWTFLFSSPFPGSTPASSAKSSEAGANATLQDNVQEAEWLTRYVVRQLGAVEAPVEVVARFADGSELRDTWDGRGGYRMYEHRTSSRLLEVVVDPERRFLIDLDVNNNGYRMKADTETTRTLSAYSHFWIQNILGSWALAF